MYTYDVYAVYIVTGWVSYAVLSVTYIRYVHVIVVVISDDVRERE